MPPSTHRYCRPEGSAVRLENLGQCKGSPVRQMRRSSVLHEDALAGVGYQRALMNAAASSLAGPAASF